MSAVQRLNMFRNFTTQGVVDALNNWCADEREREGWNDADRQTYRYRADLLAEAAKRLDALRVQRLL